MEVFAFKCWFPFIKKMSEPFILGDGIEQMENRRREERGIYLMSTEKTDREGRMIYQGHILKHKSGAVCYVDWHTWYPCLTVYEDCDEIEPNIDLREIWEDEGGGEDFEIIGDIYQNLDLVQKYFPCL